MCCGIATLVLLGPRVLDALLWLFWPQFSLAFKSDFLVPLLGVLLLPWTTLMYVLVWQPATGVSGFGWILVAFGFILDISSYTGGAQTRRRQTRVA